MNVSTAVDLANDVLQDLDLPPAALRAFASLGASGGHLQNAERDLHRWLKNLFGFTLQPYTIELNLQVARNFCKQFTVFRSMTQRCIPLTCTRTKTVSQCFLQPKVDSKKTKPTNVSVLLPHEVVHALASSNVPFVWDSIMLGNIDAAGRSSFWEHVRGLRPWSEHPIFDERGISFDKLLGFTIHGDGAVFKREDEVFVWSMSSIFAYEGMIQDVLLMKIPLCIIPERYMVSKSALWSSFSKGFVVASL